MADDTPASDTPKTPAVPAKSKGLPTIAKVAIGCVAVLIVLGIVSTLVVGYVVKKAGKTILEKAIESKTGVKTNLEDVAKGKMTFTDEKTGQKVEVGTGKIPDTFPKDFPVYPGSKVTSSLSGTGTEEKNGFWLTLTTQDAFDKVAAYYKTNLKSNGWKTSSTLETATNLTLAVGKGTLEGTLTVGREADAKETTILIILGESTATTTPEATIPETPAAE